MYVNGYFLISNLAQVRQKSCCRRSTVISGTPVGGNSDGCFLCVGRYLRNIVNDIDFMILSACKRWGEK